MKKMSRGQFQGYLLEAICKRLLEDAGFTEIPPETDRIVRASTGSKIEIYGRGTKHQIDLPYEFNYHIPFVNPIQVIGEVKFHCKPITKEYIREFIGVIEDISSNYVVFNLNDISNLQERRLIQALYVSAEGFQVEAEKLAYAHNIKLISFIGNPVLKPIMDYIVNTGINFAQGGYLENINFTRNDLLSIFDYEVKSYFLATTRTGLLMYFVSNDTFDFDELSYKSNARIFYKTNESTGDPLPYIIMVLNGVEFFSTLPTEIYKSFVEEHRREGNAINTKERHFGPLTIYKKKPNEEMRMFLVNYQVPND